MEKDSWMEFVTCSCGGGKDESFSVRLLMKDEDIWEKEGGEDENMREMSD